MNSKAKSSRRAYFQVYQCCSCTCHSICAMLGPYNHSCKCRNNQHQCIDCMFWRQCRNHVALLPQTPGEGLLGHLHPQTLCTSGCCKRHAELRGGVHKGRRGDHAADKVEESRYYGEEDSDWPAEGDNSSASGAYFTGDNKSSMEGVDGKSGEEEEIGGWHTVARRRRRRGGRKARAQGHGGRHQLLGNGDGVNKARRQHLGNIDGTNKEIQQSSGDGDSAN